MPDDFELLSDYNGRSIRLTDERWQHILEHPEMVEQHDRIQETLKSPELVVETVKDSLVHAYHRLYEKTPVTRKYMIVAVKIEFDDAFVITAFYSSRQKRGKVIWHR